MLHVLVSDLVKHEDCDALSLPTTADFGTSHGTTSCSILLAPKLYFDIDED